MLSRYWVSALLLICSFTAVPLDAHAEVLSGRVAAAYDSVLILQTPDSTYNGVHVNWRDIKFTQGKSELEMLVGEQITVYGNAGGFGVLIANEIDSGKPRLSVPRGMQTFPRHIMAIINANSVFIDTRPAEAYTRERIPNALQEAELKGKSVVLYGEGFYDSVPLDMLQSVLNSGASEVYVISGGLSSWRNSFPTSVPPAAWLSESADIAFIDARPAKEAAKGHIKGALNIPPSAKPVLDALISANAGALSPRPIVVYGAEGNDKWAMQLAYELSGRHVSVGSMKVGVLDGGFKAWKASKLPIAKGAPATKATGGEGTVSFEEFAGYLSADTGDPVLLEVKRGVDPGAARYKSILEVMVEEMPNGIENIPRDKDIVIYCATGYRSWMAYQILKREGYKVRYLNRSISIGQDGHPALKY